jgi:hypothetical protein
MASSFGAARAAHADVEYETRRSVMTITRIHGAGFSAARNAVSAFLVAVEPRRKPVTDRASAHNPVTAD